MTSNSRLPSLTALRAFESVARHLSFSRAAEELHVTKAAIAQQVRALEEEIGATLVERHGRGLQLTDAGQAGKRELAEGFGHLAQAARKMRATRGRQLLVVGVDPSFAATWLVGRIGRFKQAHQDIDLLLDATRETQDGMDVAIRWGTGDFPLMKAQRLFDESVFPVCSPALLAGEPPLREPADLVRHTLLHLQANPAYGGWPDWETWLFAAGVGEIDSTRGVWFSQMSLTLRSAIAGQGVALATQATAGDDMQAGRLAAPFKTSVETPFGYYLLCKPERMASPKVAAFRKWLTDEARALKELRDPPPGIAM